MDVPRCESVCIPKPRCPRSAARSWSSMRWRGSSSVSGIRRATAASYVRLFPDATSIETIPNGVDLAELSMPARRPQQLPPEIPAGKYLLFLGRLKHQKGVDLLLSALAVLPHLANDV